MGQALGNISVVNATAGQVRLVTSQALAPASPLAAMPLDSLGAEVADGEAAANGSAPASAAGADGSGSTLQGVLLATSGLQLPNGDAPVSQLAGAFASAQTAAQLLFTLEDEVILKRQHLPLVIYGAGQLFTHSSHAE